jgi:tripartite-type tricarboxylate transporter receptor subunit TctC
MIRRLPLPGSAIAGLLFLACALTPAAHAAESADWPSRPVTLVVPFPPGGGNDAVARQIAGPVGQALGQPLVIENRPGAGGTIGSAAVARARPDGYTLLLCSTSSLVMATALYPGLPYRVEDLAPVVHIADTPTIWVADPAVSANNLQEFIAAAKQVPGKYGYASGGKNTMPHLAGQTVSARHGLDMLHVPYRGSTPAYADLAVSRDWPSAQISACRRCRPYRPWPNRAWTIWASKAGSAFARRATPRPRSPPRSPAARNWPWPNSRCGKHSPGRLRNR